jgi:tetratricopeptide (TPR) repeat protein
MSRKERIGVVEGIDLPPGAQLSRASMISVAQKAGADLVVIGEFAGREQNLKISVKVLDVKTMKLGGEMVANGPLSALPQMENELSWLILSNSDIEKPSSRENFAGRMRKVPNSAYSLFIQSLIASNEKNQLSLLVKAVEAYRDFPRAQFQIGRLYFRKGDCKNSLLHLSLGRDEDGAGLESDFMCGTCYLQENLPDQAIQAFSRVLLLFRSVEVLNNLGVTYLRKGDYAQAQSNLLEAWDLSRIDSTVSLNLAIIRHMQGNDAAARVILEDTLKAHPKNGMLQFLSGFLLKAQGEDEKAAAATGKAKNLGINVEKLQAEDPRTWSRLFSTWE